MFVGAARKWILLGLWLLGVALLVFAIVPGRSGPPPAFARPNIVFISIDTLRADRTSLHGHDRRTTPFIDALARDGVVYQNALSQAPWTLPSAASFNTGLYPSEHGAMKIGKRLSRRFDTIAEVLRRFGYHTIGVISHDLVGRKYGFAQGFQQFDESQMRNQRIISSRALTHAAFKRLNKRHEGKPFFLWIHYFDPHFDYIRHPEYKWADATEKLLQEKFVRTRYSAGDPKRMYKKIGNKGLFLDHIRAVYDEEIAYTDRWVGKIFKWLTKAGLSDNTMTIITADHGEYFMERGRFLHDGDVYTELVHVPLVIGGAIDPALRGKTVRRTVELLSLPKTIAKMAGIEEHPFRGEDLLSLATRARAKPRFAFSEGTWAWKEDGRTAGVVYDGWKLIRNFDDERYELYHTNVDKKEKKDLFNSTEKRAKRVRKRLKQALDNHVKSKWHIDPKAEQVQVTEEEEARLRALGYVE
jgi:arylsulfatase A-like enzyme